MIGLASQTFFFKALVPRNTEVFIAAGVGNQDSNIKILEKQINKHCGSLLLCPLLMLFLKDDDRSPHLGRDNRQF